MTTTIQDLIHEAGLDTEAVQSLDGARESLDAREWFAYLFWASSVNPHALDVVFFDRLRRGKQPTEPYRDIQEALNMADETITLLNTYGWELRKTS